MSCCRRCSRWIGPAKPSTLHPLRTTAAMDRRLQRPRLARRSQEKMPMFSLTVVDHVRLDSDHIAQNYMIHARGAERIVRFVFMFRMVIVALLAVATAAATGALVLSGRGYQIAAAVTSAL